MKNNECSQTKHTNTVLFQVEGDAVHLYIHDITNSSGLLALIHCITRRPTVVAFVQNIGTCSLSHLEADFHSICEYCKMIPPYCIIEARLLRSMLHDRMNIDYGCDDHSIVLCMHQYGRFQMTGVKCVRGDDKTRITALPLLLIKDCEVAYLQRVLISGPFLGTNGTSH